MLKKMLRLTAVVCSTWLIGSSAMAQATATYNYDAQGRLVSIVYPSGVQTTYTYDGANNRARVQVTNGPPPPVNQAPACANRAINLGAIPNGGIGVSISLNPITLTPVCTDPNGDALTLISVTGFTNGAMGSVSGVNAVVNNIKAPGTVFTYAVSDGHGHTIYPTFNISRYQ